MVSFTDHENGISIDILPSKTKTRKIHNTLIILFYGSSSSPQLQKFAFLLKRQKTTNLQRVTSWNIPNLVLKRMERYFLNIPTLKKLLEFQDWKKDNEAYEKNEISSQKLNHWLKTYKMNFIN